ncbi:MAG TPA: hypothetical protein VFX44_06900 [Solirubrobacterales bacterium]|nr:hypothetical protein [Solirubrobacterales bacterium]
MKYLKILGLAAIAAGALMAFVGAGTASATQLTCKNASGTIEVCPKGTPIHLASEGHAIFDNEALGNIECNSTIEGSLTEPGTSTTTASAPIKAGGLTFTNCTSAIFQVLRAGTLEIHTQGSSANNNGTLTWTGAEWTVEKFGFHCIFSTSNTDLGTVTGSSTTGATATLDISARIPRTGGRSGIFCGESSPWTGSYKIDNPDWLDVD